VIVEAFDIAYHRSNESITFSFSFASVSNDLNVSANIYVNAYGRQVINQTLNLCDYLQGVICPLPQVNFTGECSRSVFHFQLTGRIRHLPHPHLLYRRHPGPRLHRPKPRGLRPGPADTG
jgi:hypothetical protein